MLLYSIYKIHVKSAKSVKKIENTTEKKNEID